MNPWQTTTSKGGRIFTAKNNLKDWLISPPGMHLHNQEVTCHTPGAGDCLMKCVLAQLVVEGKIRRVCIGRKIFWELVLVPATAATIHPPLVGANDKLESEMDEISLSWLKES